MTREEKAGEIYSYGFVKCGESQQLTLTGVRNVCSGENFRRRGILAGVGNVCRWNKLLQGI